MGLSISGTNFRSPASSFLNFLNVLVTRSGVTDFDLVPFIEADKYKFLSDEYRKNIELRYSIVEELISKRSSISNTALCFALLTRGVGDKEDCAIILNVMESAKPLFAEYEKEVAPGTNFSMLSNICESLIEGMKAKIAKGQGFTIEC